MIYYELNLLSKLEGRCFTAVYYDFNNNSNQNCMSPPVNDTMHQGGERQKDFNLQIFGSATSWDIHAFGVV